MTEPIDQSTKERIEKELYKHIDTFTGNRGVHTPSLVNDLLKMFIKELKQERNKVIDSAIENIKAKETYVGCPSGEAIKILEFLKDKSHE